MRPASRIFDPTGLTSEMIVQRFARAPPTRGFGGLGLWIARELLEAMGGTIRVESTPGEGAMFEIALGCEAQAAAPAAG